MRIISIVSIVFMFSSLMQAQVFTGKSAENIVPGCQLVRLNEKNKTVSYVKLYDDKQVLAGDNKTWLANSLGLEKGFSLKLINQESDKLGYVHYKYQVMFQGFPIEGYVYYVHTKNGKVISANGDFSKPTSYNITKSFSAKDAFNKAIQYFAAEKYKWEDDKSVSIPESNLVIIPENGIYKLVYKIDIYSVKPLRREFVYVDATNGKIIKTVNRIQTTNTTGTADTKYNGTCQITADSYSGSYRLKEYGNRGQGIETYDLNSSTSTSSAVDFTDIDNYWNTTANQDNAAYDAHYGAEATYDYFFTKFGRNSIDGSGFMLTSYVHYNYNYVNAFWDGQAVSYGDGDGMEYTALTSLDIVAHEITHGLTQFTANLEYSSESGALNESFSDIFGITVDYYKNPTTANWLNGDQVSMLGSAFRNMANPNQYQNPDTYKGQYWDFAQEVHCNSGVQNYWYYLLCNGGTGVNDIGNSFNVTGIGMDKAAQIAYRNLSVYLTQYSTYADARFYAIQAAIDLFGACSAETIATTNAWYAVGVGNVFSNAVIADFTTPQTYFCTSPVTVNFTSTSVNSTSFAWNFGDGSTSLLNNPSHYYSTPGTYTVQLITTGSASCGGTSDTMLKTSFITVSNTGGPVTASCSPTTVNSSGHYGITSFTFNTINKTSTGSADGYKDYTCSNSTTLMEGQRYNFSVTNESTSNSSLKIWLDINNDGLFNNTSELLFSNTNALQYTSGNILIPAGTVFNAPLRLRVASDLSGSYISTSCTNSQYGQYEDYSVVLQQNTSAPDADFIANNTSVNVGQAIIFTDQSLNVPASWQWSFIGGTPSSSTIQNPTVVYNALGTYDVKLKASNSDGTDSIIKTGYIHVVNSYNMCSTTTTTSQNGVLYDSGGLSGNYANYENCSFLINVSCATTITLSFSSFQTQSSYDYLRVYDGANSSGMLLLSVSGSSLPSTVVAHSGKMYIQFTSDSYTAYPGFAASWSSVVPAGTPPAGDFSIPSANAPINWPVHFIDQTTNGAVAWNWYFGDGGFSSLQNPLHSYFASGTYDITLIVSNCFSYDTIVKSLVVQDAPTITVAPLSINTTITGCNDSTIIPITISNSGIGDLLYDITTSNDATGGSNIIFDNFEDGDYNGWSVGSNHTAMVSTTSPANGTKCLSLSGGGTSFTGLYRSISNATPDKISLYIKQATTSCANYFTVGDDNIQSNSGIIYMYFYNSNIYIYNGSSTVSLPYLINQWYHIEFKNINYTTKKFDAYVNGTLFQANLSFRSNTSTFISRIHMYNYYTGTTYYDDICIGDPPSIHNWITATPDSAIVSAGNSTVVNIQLNSTGLSTGTYTSLITVNNNDPLHPAITVPCTFTLIGAPIMTFSDSCLNYGYILEYTNKKDTLKVINSGCDTLRITNIMSTIGEYTALQFQLTVAPNDTGLIVVVFHPSSLGIYTGYLNITSNAGNKTVCLNGSVTGAPIISVNPTAFNVSINTCNDSVTYPLHIYNTGLGPLTWNYQQPIATVSDDFDPGVDNTFWQNITSGVAASTCGYYSAPNALYFNGSIREAITKPINTTSGGNIGFYLEISSGTSPCETADPGEDILLSYSNNNGSTWTTIQTFLTGSYTNFTQINISIPVAARTTATLFKWAQPMNSGSGCDNWSIDNVVISSSSSSSFIHLLPSSGIVNSGDSAIVYVTFSSNNLSSGMYNNAITLNSNDPQHLHTIISSMFTVIGIPAISVSDTCLHFGTIIQHGTKKDSLWIYNSGCDTLRILNINASSAEFIPEITHMNIAPNDSAKLIVDFNPDSIGSINGILTIYNNAGTRTVCLNGTATGAPHALFNPTSFNITLASCNDSVTYPLHIYNSGLSSLTWTYQQPMASITDDFDPGVDNTVWQSINGGIAANTCGYYSAPNSLYFNGTIREAITKPINTTSGGNIGFNILISGGSSPCEMADGGEDIILSYSNNSGSSWIAIQTFLAGSYNSFTSVNVSIPLAARTTATMFKWAQPSFSGTGYDNWSIDNVSISSLSSPFIHLSTTSGNINPGDSTTVYVTFSSHNLIAGTYNGMITFTMNDPQNPQAIIPCTLTVVGTPVIALSQPCLYYGNVIQFTQTRDTLLVFNRGCGILNVSNITSSSGAFTVSPVVSAILPNDTGVFVVTFNPTTIGSFSGNLHIYNNDNDTVVCMTGVALSAPVINVTPSSFNVTLNACGSSTTLPLNIGNTGGSNLNYTIEGGGATSNMIQLLAFTNGVDYDEEYANTITAIRQYYTNYQLTEINTTSASALQSALVGKQVLLVSEQGEQTTPSIFTSMASVFQNFVNTGGTVIFCGVAPSYSSCIFNTGLFAGSYVNYTSSSSLIVNNTHPITHSVPTTMTAQNSTTYCSFTNSDAVRLVSYGSYDVVTYRQVGSGKVIYVGFDYFAFDSNAALIIANAVQWGGEGVLPPWLSLSSGSGSVVPGQSQIVDVTFNSSGLPGGTYTGNITVNSNDPVNTQVIVPCTLQVTYMPCVAFGYNLASCNGSVAFTDSTINTPTSWHWSFGDGTSSTVRNPAHSYTYTGVFDVELIACNSYGCDTFVRSVYVSSLSGPVAASCTPATTNNCCGMGILHVIFNTINNTTGDGSEGYQDYTCTQTTNLLVSQPYTLSVQTGSSYSENVGAWIDFNNNGSFETGEKVLTSANNNMHSATITMPTSAVLNTPLRMRIGSEYYSSAAPSACSNVSYGQFEDYSVVIQPSNQPPVANFTVNMLDNCLGMVQLLNQSSNNPSSVSWSFGDGSFSTNTNPYHNYIAAGNYSVTLTATNAFGSDTHTSLITISSLTASFSADSSLYAGSMVYFYANAPGATIFNWNFGDGYSATMQNPVHMYPVVGTYDVTLNVSNTTGCNATSARNIYIDFPVSVSGMSSLNDIAIFPNPNRGSFSIEIHAPSIDKIPFRIINCLGEDIYKDEIYKTNGIYSKKVETANLPKGVYYIKFIEKNATKVIKLVIE